MHVGSNIHSTLVSYLYQIPFDGSKAKGESQNGCFKKAKHAKFSVKQTFLPPDTENLACFAFLKHPFWDSPFRLITDDVFLKLCVYVWNVIILYLIISSVYKQIGRHRAPCLVLTVILLWQCMMRTQWTTYSNLWFGNVFVMMRLHYGFTVKKIQIIIWITSSPLMRLED